jgi:hypothetical protein
MALAFKVADRGGGYLGIAAFSPFLPDRNIEV